MSRIQVPANAEQNDSIAQWAASQIPWLKTGDSFGPCQAWAVTTIEGTTIKGALIFNNYRPAYGDIELNVITKEPGWASADLFDTIADYVFNQMKCERMSVTLPRGAKQHREHAERVGFKLEGVKRRGFHNGKDAMMYGMLKEECRFLKAEAA